MEPTHEVRPVEFPPLSEGEAQGASPAVPWELLATLEVPVRVEMGQVELSLQELLELAPGSVLELDKAVGEPVEVYVAGRLLAYGELVVVFGDRLGVRITEILKPS